MTNKAVTFSTPRDLLERALSSSNGIRVWFSTQSEAIAMRNRMNTVKTEDRKQSTKLYPFDSPLYNTSPYDGVATSIMPVEIYQTPPPEGYPTYGVWLYVNPSTCASNGMFVEEL